MKKIFVVTDNQYIYEEFQKIIDTKSDVKVTYFCSLLSTKTFSKEINELKINPIDMKSNPDFFINNFDLGISCHSKQIFPAKLVNKLLCINIHPGFNPYNRGWYPQVFSIINGLPAGATIHVMDEEIDHGDIITQEIIEIEPFDNSFSVYQKILSKEIELLKKSIDKILNMTFSVSKPISEGNYNSIQDYKNICKIDLDKSVTMKEAIDFFRALTHPPHNNCFFEDENGEKIYVSINLKKEDKL